MDWLNTPDSGADIAHGSSTLLSTIDAFRQGNQTAAIYNNATKNVKKGAAFENTQLAAMGKDAIAASQRQALDETKQSKLTQSRAVAVAAGTGGGASDPSVMSIIKNLASEGNTNALSALYTGEAANTEYQNRISANTYEAKATAAGYGMRAKAESGNKWNTALSTILSGVPSFLEKYG